MLPHEYTLVQNLWALKEAEYGNPTDLSGLTFELENLGKIRQFPLVVSREREREVYILLSDNFIF